MKTNNPRLRALTTSKERQEIRAIGTASNSARVEAWLNTSQTGDILEVNGVTLRRSFDQKFPGEPILRFARVIAPATHRNYESDLSPEGLKEWGII